MNPQMYESRSEEDIASESRVKWDRRLSWRLIDARGAGDGAAVVEKLERTRVEYAAGNAESFTERCRECGRRLVSAMSSLSGEVTRQQAVQDARALSRAVSDPTLIKLRDQGTKDIEALSQKALRLPASEDVRFVLERIERLFKEVDGTADKLEDMVEKRREKLKDFQRVKALEKETEQVIGWSETGNRRHQKPTLPQLTPQMKGMTMRRRRAEIYDRSGRTEGGIPIHLSIHQALTFRSSLRKFFPGFCLVKVLIHPNTIESVSKAKDANGALTSITVTANDPDWTNGLSFSGAMAFEIYQKLTEYKWVLNVPNTCSYPEMVKQIYFHSVFGTYKEDLGILKWMTEGEPNFMNRKQRSPAFGKAEKKMSFTPYKLKRWSKLASAQTS
ncbi:unnamed protein product [Nezara viridula]|uniref:Uncharacterized protein n=1 Tax=Nezara viridula TaxID=85310 RepID=A0A9P0EEQ4_NEZVI|nr:unnamed protein product [Nezara viridula]